MHAAPGCQNGDWHSDSDGRAELWSKKYFQNRTINLWEFLADRYKNEEYVAGYDLLNEPVVNNAKILNMFYEKLIKAIRKVDNKHILFIEGNFWSTDLKCLKVFKDDNYILSLHFYEPIDFTFNFVPSLRYPKSFNGKIWSRNVVKSHIRNYAYMAKERNIPILAGEFGVNSRNGFYGEDVWLDNLLSLFKSYDISWTYWTYKAVKNNIFPDGIYSYYNNPLWVNRGGAKTGWNMFADCWRKYRKKIINSWDTRNFEVNDKILQVLTKYAR